ncbi:ELWxxDGT repeat protein [Myxococcus stipitatus]|uniref:ELWxxDGT repeat protein n=1 Tax=Myxococcus stipitatus TaxID=83455 RepID=UPI0030D3CCF0
MRFWSCGLVVMGCLLASCSSSTSTPEPVEEVGVMASGLWDYCSRTAVSLGVTPVEDQPFSPVMAVSGGGMVFGVVDPASGHEPWVSSGSPGAGTRLLKDLFPGPQGSNPRGFTRVGSRVFFAADDPAAGRELFVTDGTAAGTQRVKDIWPGPTGSFPDSLYAYGGLLYFTAGDADHGRELWRSDGTSAGTSLVVDLVQGMEDSSPDLLTRGGDGALYFKAIDSSGLFSRLMRMGSSLTVTEVFRITSDPGIQAPLVPVGRKLFFATGGTHGVVGALRVTDSGGPAVVLGQFSMLGDMAGVDGLLLFSATQGEGSEDMELWRSDGTAPGTVLVEDAQAGPVGSTPDQFTVLSDQLFFSADDGIHGAEPWVSDGTAAGTHLFGDLELGPGGSSPQGLTTVEDHFFFSADVYGRGEEPWVSNGLRVGTVALTELAPGPASSSPRGFLRSGWSVFFSAADGSGVRWMYALPFRPDGQCPP